MSTRRDLLEHAHHPDLIARAAAAGKAILCEKPSRSTSMSSTARSPRSRAAGVPFQIGFNRRFDPPTRRFATPSPAPRSASHISPDLEPRPAPPPLEYSRVSAGCSST
jgi:myo-inositol 2-dehydrogenase/D-chiro-inositol 1-dehydrogenase